MTEIDGVRLLDGVTLDAGLIPMREGESVFPTSPPWPRWGRGFQFDSEARRYLGPEIYGHDGAGGQVAFADRPTKTGFAFLTNWMEAAGDDRATDIVAAGNTLRGAEQSLS